MLCLDSKSPWIPLNHMQIMALRSECALIWNKSLCRYSQINTSLTLGLGICLSGERVCLASMKT